MTIEGLLSIIQAHYGSQPSAISEFYNDLGAFIQECPGEYPVCGDNPVDAPIKCLHCWQNSGRTMARMAEAAKEKE